MYCPESEAGDFVEDGNLAFPEAGRPGIDAWRTVNDDPFAGHHVLDAEEMIAVTYGNAGAHGVGAHDGGHATRGFGGICALGFGNELVVGNAEGFQILATNATFVELGIITGAARGDDNGGEAAMVELGGMIESRLVNGRRATVILSRAEYHNGIRGAGFIDHGMGNDQVVKHGGVARRGQQEPQQMSLAEGCRHLTDKFSQLTFRNSAMPQDGDPAGIAHIQNGGSYFTGAGTAVNDQVNLVA
jgi:hypothetical protein